MQAIKLADCKDLCRDDWLRIRKTGVGGSDAAAIAGLSRWKSPIGVWLEKTGRASEAEQTERMYFGSLLEDLVAREFELRSGKKVRRCNFILQHPEHSVMLANVDRLVVGEKAGLECKTAGEFAGKQYEGEDFLPEHFLQCQHYLGVTGYDKWYLAILIGGQRFLWKEILPDLEMIAHLIKIENDFWDLVKSDTPPAADGSEACTEDIKSMYPRADGETIELDDTADALIQVHEFAKKEEVSWCVQKEAAANSLRLLLGEASFGLRGEYQVRWPNLVQHRVDTKRLKSEYPEVWEKCRAEVNLRRFEVKLIKKKEEKE